MYMDVSDRCTNHYGSAVHAHLAAQYVEGDHGDNGTDRHEDPSEQSSTGTLTVYCCVFLRFPLRPTVVF